VNSNTATSRLVNEELLVSSVHLSKVGHISQEDLGKKSRSAKRPPNLCILLPSKAETINTIIIGLGNKTYIDLDNLVHAGTSGGQDSLDVIAANLCLGADVALDQVGGSIGGDLAGDEDLAVGADGLGLFGFVRWFFYSLYNMCRCGMGDVCLGVDWSGVEGEISEMEMQMEGRTTYVRAGSYREDQLDIVLCFVSFLELRQLSLSKEAGEDSLTYEGRHP
jgi:hypothetical protein